MLDRRGSHVGEDGTRPTRSKSSLSTKRNANMKEEEEEEKQRIRASCISKCYAFENQPFRRFLLLSLSLYFCLFPFFCLTFFNIYLSTYYVRARFFRDSIILTSTMKPTISPCREKIFEKNLPILISFFFFFDPSEK